MHPLPHRYIATARGDAAGSADVEAPSLPPIPTDSPVEFGGPGDRWSPEALLCASIADCFVLTFRALAKTGGLDWADVECRVEGVLDRVDRVTQFTSFTTHATLRLREGADPVKADALLHKAEERCLVANSLKGRRELVAEIRQA